MNLLRNSAAALLFAAAGAAVPTLAAGQQPTSDCALEQRERVQWRLHGNPAKPVAAAERVRESRHVCTGVVGGDWRRDGSRGAANG